MNKCIAILCFSLGSLNIAMITILPKLNRCNVLCIRVTVGYFIELVKFIVKFPWKNKWARITKNTFI